MRNIIDLSGKRFSRLSVVRQDGFDKHKKTMWVCVCDCGNIISGVRGNDLKMGKIKSCKCLRIETTIKRCTVHGDSRGGRKAGLIQVHANMKQRCGNPNDTNYHHYGGRGIHICKEWHSYINFKAWAVANGYKKHLTIERIDNSMGYEPSNCKFTTMLDQSNNRRSNVVVSHNGITLNVTQWINRLSVNKSMVWGRIRRGWTAERALFTPMMHTTRKVAGSVIRQS